MREYVYGVDAEGHIFHDGSEIVGPATLRFFLLALQRTPEGRWLVLCCGSGLLGRPVSESGRLRPKNG